jgi:CheY-like chemotaxis protein
MGRRDDGPRCRELGVTTLSKPAHRLDLLEAITQASDAARESGRSVVGAERHDSPAARTLHILVAEDNPVNQKLAYQLLIRRGYTVHTVSNGREAVAAVEAGAFDLVLMDVQMPVMGGFEAAQEIRKREQEAGRRTPILALTAHAMAEVRGECLAAGMDDYLTKTVEADRALCRGRAAHEARRGAAPAPRSRQQRLCGRSGRAARGARRQRRRRARPVPGVRRGYAAPDAGAGVRASRKATSSARTASRIA